MTEIWHNPRCGKSRETLALLESRGINPGIRRYLDDPPTEADLRAALAALGQPAHALLRWKDAPDLDPGMGEDAVIATLAARPALIERPLVIHGGRAALGRPPETVLALF